MTGIITNSILTTTNSITPSTFPTVPTSGLYIQYNEKSYSGGKFYYKINTGVYLVGATTTTYNSLTIMNFTTSISSASSYNFNMGSGNWNLFYVFNTPNTTGGNLLIDRLTYSGFPQLNLSIVDFSFSVIS